MSKPIESYPRKLIPHDYWPPPGIKHYFKTGERWESVAAQHQVDVKHLIYHNFKTTRSSEVNWYLSNLIGCNQTTDGKNWAFSSTPKPGFPGYVVVPTTVVNMEPEEITAEAPEDLIQRLKPLVTDIPGLLGKRIRCLLALAERVGSPLDEHLWYYSSQPTLIYTNWHTKDQTRRWMTQATNGQPPFNGYAGPAYGNWRTYPFRDLKIACIPGCSDNDLRHKMGLIEEDFRKSFYYVSRLNYTGTQGGGSSNGPLIEAFAEHVSKLSKHPHHLYSCGPIGPKQFYWWPD